MSFTAPVAYDRFMGRYSALLSPQLADLAGVEPGQRALDVGCGPGALTGVLVDRLGAELVAAVDPSGPFVGAAASATRASTPEPPQRRISPSATTRSTSPSPNSSSTSWRILWRD